MQFSRDNHRLIIELHWEVAPHLFASTVNGERLWQDLITLDLNGTTIKTFSAEDLLFSLCVHGSRHLWERLGWICDVAELITRRSLDWTALLERAASADTERMFLLGVHLAERLLDAPLPAEVKQRCDSDPRLSSLADNIIEHLFNGPTHVPATSREIFKYNIGVRKTLSARARYLLYMFRPTDSDLGSRSLPRQLEFCVLPHATVSFVSYENLTDFFARVSFTATGGVVSRRSRTAQLRKKKVTKALKRTGFCHYAMGISLSAVVCLALFTTSLAQKPATAELTLSRSQKIRNRQTRKQARSCRTS